MKNSKQSTAMLLLMSLMFGSSNVVFAENQDQLAPITVSGTAETKAQEGKDQVYLKNQVTEYKSKKEIEAYRGNSAGDLLAGFSGVYSGDVRNGGAIDPIIRGSWGQGRIPVIVDGSEQAVTVWRGFAGVSNRNYLDPFLVSNVTVEKGNRLGRDLSSGPDGTVRMTTLEVDDIVKPGQKWGVEIKTETATNSAKREKSHYTFGKDYRFDLNSQDSRLGNWGVLFKQSDRFKAKSGNRNKPFNDNALRLAVAMKEDKFEGLLAYAYRKKGNYYAGAHGAEKYGENVTLEEVLDPSNQTYQDMLKSDDAYVPLIGMVYKKKHVVPNTSYKSNSVLAKTKFKFNDEASLAFGLRHTKLDYGDIMPSRLYNTLAQLGTVVEWPEANVKQTTFNTEFKYNPKDNPLINFKANAYYVKNKSQTNTAGGTPGDVLYEDTYQAELLRQYPDFMPYAMKIFDGTLDIHDPGYIKVMKQFIEDYKNNPNKTPNIDGVFNTRAAQAQFTRDNHWGLNLSNRFEINTKLNLDVMANYRRETLDSSNVYELWDKLNTPTHGSSIEDYPNIKRVGNEAISGKRKGKRNEFNAGFNFSYTPTDWLVLTAGARYTHYKLKDTGLAEKIASGDKIQHEVGRYFNVEKTLTKEDIEKYTKIIEQKEANGEPLTAIENKVKNLNKKIYTNPYSTPPQKPIIPPSLPPFMQNILQQNYQKQLEEYNANKDSWKPDPGKIDISEFEIGDSASTTEEREETRIYWYKGKDGKYHVENNPLFDGRITDEMRTERQKHPFTGEETPCSTEQDGTTSCSHQYHISSFTHPINEPYTKEELAKLLEPKTGHAWTPSLSITAFITDNARVYARYNETKRMPSIFEATTGYSANGIDLDTQLKPEHTKSFELGYVQDLTGIFPSLRRADFRINYFHNTTRNIFDRVGNIWDGFKITQMDKKTIEGIEVQGRYDQGNFFGDISFTYNLKNKICDKNQAFLDTPSKYISDYLHGESKTLKTYPTCVNGGFNDGYLKNTILPKYSVVGNLGLRALNEKLEIGTRLTYHTNVKETYAKSIRDAGFETPLNASIVRWKPVFLVDMYSNYQISKNLNISLSVTNLTDRYYLDPYTRSSMPAPGRTFKLGLTGTF